MSMKIVFLHLSDLHLRDASGAHPSRINLLVNSLHHFDKFDGILIIFSGDIASKGNPNEYLNAAKFIGRLVCAIKSTFSVEDKNLKVLMVPGNHDISYPSGHRPDHKLVRSEHELHRDKYLNSELGKMAPFFNFANNNKCFFIDRAIDYGQLFTRKILHFSNGYMIEANLFNSAPFSCEHDDGLHYFPEGVIDLLERPSNANLSIAIMHHSIDWFSFDQKKQLQSAISHRCSFAFFGHEHISTSQGIIYEGVDQIISQVGGAWHQESAPNVCEYYASLYDTDERNYSILKFTWNGNQFIASPSGTYILAHKPLNGLSLPCRKEFLSAILLDAKHSITDNIIDYYVFLKLKIRNHEKVLDDKTINSLESLLSFIMDKHYIAIIGGTNSGKTTLLKMLFTALYLNHTVLYCGIDDITGRNSDRIIKELVETTYGEHSYSAFKSIPVSSKIILIDDFHRINPKSISKFLKDIKLQFGTIVIASGDTNQLDIVQTIKDSIQIETDFNQLLLTRLYASERINLISKIVNVKYANNSISCSKLTRTLEQCLNTYKMAFSTDIDFVVQFVDYYCTHFSELNSSDATVFSKVFESSIEKAISSNLISRRETSSDIIVALSEVAYFLHFHREYPITVQHIKETIDNYCEDYDNRYLTPARFIEIAVNSGLLLVTQSGDSYRFKSKDHLAYFVAKALNRKIHESSDYTFLSQVVEQSCFGINGDILLFLTYIADNVAITRLLLNQVYALTKDWPEFDITNVTAKYLTALYPTTLSAPPENQREKDLALRSSAEEHIADELEDAIQTLDFYDYDPSLVDELGNQILRSYLALKTISRSFSAFISILPSIDKRKIVNAIFELPNLIFGKLSEEIDKEAKAIIDYLYDEVQNSTEYTGAKLSRTGILQRLQIISIQVLINMYNTATQYSVNSATVDYLVSQDIITNSTTYQLERLFFYEKVDDCASLISNAERLLEKNDNEILRLICKLCLRRMLVYSNKLSRKERLRITNKYFSNEKTELLVSHQKALPDSVK